MPASSPTRDQQCVNFLQWALPRLDMRWEGFRKVRKQVCKCIRRRMQELKIGTYDHYRDYLETHPEEWKEVDVCCRITISRFYRDRGLFARLRSEVLPGLAQRAQREYRPLRIWTAGCASGEEPYTLALILYYDFPELKADILATDVDAHMLQRARRACYPGGSLKELPDQWEKAAFEERAEAAEDPFCLREKVKQRVRFDRQDIRDTMPEGPFDLIGCRNLVAMYFTEDLQRELFRKIAGRLRPDGWLMLGAHETLPDGAPELVQHPEEALLFRKKEA